MTVRMVVSYTDFGRIFERWSETAFLVAGGVWIIDAAIYVLRIISDFSIAGAINGTLLLLALLLTLAGVFGLYVPLTDKAPRLALAGVLFGGVAGLVALTTLVWVVSAGLLNQPMPPGITLAVIVIGSIVSLFLFGNASVRTDIPSRMSGVLLLTLAATLAIWVVTGLLIATPEWTAIAYGVTFSLNNSAIAYVQRNGATPHNHQARSNAPASR